MAYPQIIQWIKNLEARLEELVGGGSGLAPKPGTGAGVGQVVNLDSRHVVAVPSGYANIDPDTGELVTEYWWYLNAPAGGTWLVVEGRFGRDTPYPKGDSVIVAGGTRLDEDYQYSPDVSGAQVSGWAWRIA